MARARVEGAYARTAIETARELGADLARLGEACGLPGLGVALPESVPVPRYLALLQAAADEVCDPFFGLHVGERMRLATYVGYGPVLCTCKDFRKVIEQTIRFEALAHDLGRSELLEAGDTARYRWHSPWLGEIGGRHVVESVAAGIRVMADWLAGESVPALEICFQHAVPEGQPSDEYQRVLAAPVRFGAEANEARFPSALLDLAVPNADPSLFPAVVQAAEQRLAAHRRALQEPAVVEAVRRSIQAHLTRDAARLPEVATALGMTPRTLQRKLAGAGVTFSGLLDLTRRELAQSYLRDRGLTLAEIAFLLGFREQSSFSHAFRAWFGETPAAWREANVAPP
ncbi:MAG TPA: AraC family transcriptional regulator ligand-binding domain-containing protein [Anaeromyxobacter sp.]|nr:AraC family transcriptional regulator ligand-binding domain-containing protein [Anaeromyxobacter sp.]